MRREVFLPRWSRVRREVRGSRVLAGGGLTAFHPHAKNYSFSGIPTVCESEPRHSEAIDNFSYRYFYVWLKIQQYLPPWKLSLDNLARTRTTDNFGGGGEGGNHGWTVPPDNFPFPQWQLSAGNNFHREGGGGGAKNSKKYKNKNHRGGQGWSSAANVQATPSVLDPMSRGVNCRPEPHSPVHDTGLCAGPLRRWRGVGHWTRWCKHDMERGAGRYLRSERTTVAGDRGDLVLRPVGGDLIWCLIF